MAVAQGDTVKVVTCSSQKAATWSGVRGLHHYGMVVWSYIHYIISLTCNSGVYLIHHFELPMSIRNAHMHTLCWLLYTLDSRFIECLDIGCCFLYGILNE